MISKKLHLLALAGLLVWPMSVAAGETALAVPESLAACASIFDPVGMPSGRDGADEISFVFANAPAQAATDKQEALPGKPTFAYKCYKGGFAVRLNAVTKVPDWVAEDITVEESQGNATRSNAFFVDPDPEIAGQFSARLSDYQASGFDRGHQAPAGDFSGNQDLKNETFVMTNMGPQVGACFNRGIWKDLETAVRNLAGTRDRLVVFTGPLYGSTLLTIADKEKSKPGVNVAVPEAYFKIVYSPENNRAMAFRIANKAHCGRSFDETEFRASIDVIERETGFDFFPALSARRQKLLETAQSTSWTW